AVRVRTVDRGAHLLEEELHRRVPALFEFGLVRLKPRAFVLLCKRLEEAAVGIGEAFESCHAAMLGSGLGEVTVMVSAARGHPLGMARSRICFCLGLGAVCAAAACGGDAGSGANGGGGAGGSGSGASAGTGPGAGGHATSSSGGSGPGGAGP